MPTENLHLILARAIADAKYRELLFVDASQALEGYVLTDIDARALEELGREKLDALADELRFRLAEAEAEFAGRLQGNSHLP